MQFSLKGENILVCLAIWSHSIHPEHKAYFPLLFLCLITSCFLFGYFLRILLLRGKHISLTFHALETCLHFKMLCPLFFKNNNNLFHSQSTNMLMSNVCVLVPLYKILSLSGNTATLICSTATLTIKKSTGFETGPKNHTQKKVTWWKMCKKAWTEVKGACCYHHGRISWGNEQGIKILDAWEPGEREGEWCYNNQPLTGRSDSPSTQENKVSKQVNIFWSIWFISVKRWNYYVIWKSKMMKKITSCGILNCIYRYA